MIEPNKTGTQLSLEENPSREAAEHQQFDELRLVDLDQEDECSNPPEPIDTQSTARPEDEERRSKRRYKVPKIAVRIKVQRFLNATVDHIYLHRFSQFLFVAITLCSLVLTWFSLNNRVNLIDNSYQKFSELGKLETELLQIREVWSQEKMQAIAESVQNADKRRVFVDYRGLAQWLREKSEFAERLDVNFAYTLQSGVSSRIDNMLEVPIEVVITTNKESADQTYLHFLEFMKYLVSSLWYVEIVGAAIDSEGSGANRMTVTLRVWVHGTERQNVENIQ